MHKNNRGIIDPLTLGFLLSLTGSSIVVATNQVKDINQDNSVSKTPVVSQTITSNVGKQDSGKKP